VPKPLRWRRKRLEHVDEADRSFECDGVERDQGLLARYGFDVLEHLLFVVDQEITLSGAQARVTAGMGVLLAIVARELTRAVRSVGLSEHH